MKILILRTFAHSLVWENTKNHCEFEISQMDNMIYKWEPNYANLEISDFSYALGIYTHKYFNYRPRYPKAKPVFQNSENDKLIYLRDISYELQLF